MEYQLLLCDDKGNEQVLTHDHEIEKIDKDTMRFSDAKEFIKSINDLYGRDVGFTHLKLIYGEAGKNKKQLPIRYINDRYNPDDLKYQLIDHIKEEPRRVFDFDVRFIPRDFLNDFRNYRINTLSDYQIQDVVNSYFYTNNRDNKGMYLKTRDIYFKLKGSSSLKKRTR